MTYRKLSKTFNNVCSLKSIHTNFECDHSTLQVMDPEHIEYMIKIIVLQTKYKSGKTNFYIKGDE